MTPHAFTMRKALLKMIYDLAILELELEQFKDSLKECVGTHALVCMKFHIEEKEFQIRRLRYDIDYRKSCFEN